MKRPHREKIAVLRNGRYSFKIKGISQFDLRDPYHMAVTQTWPQFLIVLLGLYLAVNIVFATLYTLIPGSVANARPNNFLDAFFFSFETLATVGYGEMYPASLWGHIVACAEIVCGLSFTAILTGLTFVRFSRPKAKFIFADKLVLTTHNGRPTLMLRIGNGRPGVLADANARVNVLITEISAEGNQFRRTHELRLERKSIPILPLAWTLMHEVNKASPIFGMDASDLREAEIRIFVSVDARDPSLGATLHDVREFAPEDIAFGMRYGDAIATDDSGVIVMDLAKISSMEPELSTVSHHGGLA